MTVSETLETRGHLMDTGILARVLDDVLSYGGDYRIDRLDVGRAHDDESYARLVVSAEDDEALQRLLMRLQTHGVNQVDPGTAVLRTAERDGVFPEDFYSTTNLETVVRLDAGWGPVEQPEMDCGLVVADGRVRTVPVSDVKAGQSVVCGASGVKVVLPVPEASGSDEFGFMSSSATSTCCSPATPWRRTTSSRRSTGPRSGSTWRTARASSTGTSTTSARSTPSGGRGRSPRPSSRGSSPTA